ncbi:MAG: Crp/Fnr family transcriptional regulator [Saprospiraceae bacterium]
MHRFLSFLKKALPNQYLPPSLEQEITTSFHPISIKKNDYLIREGQICRYLYFVQSGSLRNFYLKNGREINIWFFFANDFMTVFDSLYRQTPAEENLQALENCTLYRIAFDRLQKLQNSTHHWSLIISFFTRQYAIQQKDRIYMLQAMTAVERYYYLFEHYPHLIQNLSNKQLASYLGMSRETLSRIRSK